MSYIDIHIFLLSPPMFKQRENPALPAKDERFNAQSEPRTDTAGRNFVHLLATPGWRDCLNAYVRQYEQGHGKTGGLAVVRETLSLVMTRRERLEPQPKISDSRTKSA